MSTVPALMMNSPRLLAPDAPVRAAIKKFPAKISTLCPRRFMIASGVAPVVLLIQPRLMAVRPVPARLRMVRVPVVVRGSQVTRPPERLPLTVKVFTLNTLLVDPRKIR